MRAKAAAAVVLLASCGAPPSPGPPRHAEASAGAAILAVHNRERAAFGSPPLAWDPALAAAARGWAERLARQGRLEHSPRTARAGQGENLWIGSAGAFPPTAMIAGWAAERRHFRRGTFPAVSATGNWADVGHYSQMVWPATRTIGCAIGRGARWDTLVCRYAPAGNRDGVRL